MFFEQTRRKAVAPRGAFRRLPREPIAREFMSDAELIASTGETFFFDIECFPNYFFIGFKSQRTGRFLAFEQSPRSTIDWAKLRWLLWAVELISFNGNKFDMPLLSVALIGCVDCKALKEVADDLILEGAQARDIERAWNVKIENYNHIDLIEVAPLQASLKKYAARMHAKRLQELPYSPHEALSPQQADEVADYCLTDLDNTELLWRELQGQLAMRVALSDQYGVDLRSKSDAQIAEAVIVSEVQKLTGRFPRKADVKPGHAFSYKPPEWLSYKLPTLQEAFNKVADAIFVIDDGGSPRCPAMQEVSFRIGSTTYGMGLGGLHSREKSRALYATEEFALIDIDVASYYPSLILNEGIKPSAMGDAFGKVFRSILERRLKAKAEAAAAKKAGDKEAQKRALVEADSLKITANGTFGKLGSQYSAMYAPEGMIGVTLGGQLSILLLIERLYMAGFDVVSGNTDGILVRFPRIMREALDAEVRAWEKITGLKTEETSYKAIYNRDVNNYIAIKEDGEVKVKGVYAEVGSSGNTRLSKNPEALILTDAVQAYLTKGTPIEQTVEQCTDVRRFVVVREVKGGGELAGTYLGKVVRYYYARDSRNVVTYIASGNKVPNSDGAAPCMDMPDGIPADLDFKRYIREAAAILVDIGHTIPQGSLF